MHSHFCSMGIRWCIPYGPCSYDLYYHFSKHYGQPLMSILIPNITRGSDVSLTVTITDEGGPVDLSGRELLLFDVNTVLDGRITANITDASAGVISLFIEGTDPLPLGRRSFRLQVNNPLSPEGADSIGLPPFILEVV